MTPGKLSGLIWFLLSPPCRREKFEERIVGLSPEKRQWHEQEFRKKECDFLRARRIRIGANDFRTLQVIGKGAFGTVKLVQKIDNGKLYAMKMLRKTEMIKHDQAQFRSTMTLLLNIIYLLIDGAY